MTSDIIFWFDIDYDELIACNIHGDVTIIDGNYTFDYIIPNGNRVGNMYDSCNELVLAGPYPR